ncbi:unnamed protein product [Cyclocybe aegerita]|uniref:Nephrocystin 3-like N-terminal domain-containing protein n=1 Tax=Cyclocybe aegerita TaxID=1973307 RepID=A0A8S0WCW2_CYCAE|nr:unnamed protein product [Cyclocybe aegerita]
MNIRETHSFIAAAVAHNPSIFDLSIEKQIQELILQPLSQASSSLSASTSPKLIIIDGLDECINQDAQCTIVEQFADAVRQMQHNLPQKVIIVSRPEQRLSSAFSDEKLVPCLKQLCLDNTWKPDDDIHLFLVDSFAGIKKKHPLSGLIEDAWPSEKDIRSLVLKSSGQFIFAATVVNYVKSTRHDPRERLKVVQGLKKDEKNPPFAELDALYRHILLSVENQPILVPLLRIVLMRSIEPAVDIYQPMKIARFLLDLREGVVELLLSDLASVVEADTYDEIHFHHASFQDFLLDKDRSKEFFVNSNFMNANLARDCLQLFSKYPAMDSDDCWEACLRGPEHFLYHISDDAVSVDVYDALNELDVESLLHSLSTHPATVNAKVPDGVVGLMLLSLKDEPHPSLGRTLPIPPVISKLVECVLLKLRNFPFNGFDNDPGIDIVVFAYPYEILSPSSLRKNLMAILPISLSVSPNASANPFTDELMFCFELIANWLTLFSRADIFGLYALTPPCLMNAASVCLEYLTNVL